MNNEKNSEDLPDERWGRGRSEITTEFDRADIVQRRFQQQQQQQQKMCSACINQRNGMEGSVCCV